MRVYQAKKYGEPAPHELVVWDLVFRTGWTIEYIESLSVERIYEYFELREGLEKALGNG